MMVLSLGPSRWVALGESMTGELAAYPAISVTHLADPRERGESSPPFVMPARAPLAMPVQEF